MSAIELHDKHLGEMEAMIEGLKELIITPGFETTWSDDNVFEMAEIYIRTAYKRGVRDALEESAESARECGEAIENEGLTPSPRHAMESFGMFLNLQVAMHEHEDAEYAASLKPESDS